MPDDIDVALGLIAEKAVEKRWEFSSSVDYLHWSIGGKLERPRASKHTYHRWIFKLRLLCFGVALKRLNETRVPKPPTTGVSVGTIGVPE